MSVNQGKPSPRPSTAVTPQRIAVVIGSMGSGGAERVTATLVDAWAAKGRQVDLVTIAARETDFYPLDPRVTRHALGLARDTRGFLDAGRATSQRIRALRACLRTIDPDVVVGMTTTAGILSVIAASRSRWRVVVEEHIHPPKMPPGQPWDMLRRLTYPRASHIVVLTSETLAWLDQVIPAARGVVIPNPVTYPMPVTDPIVPPAALAKEGRRILLAAGRLAPQKGFDLLIPAFASVAKANPAWDLVILGEGPDRPALEALATLDGMGDRIHLPGVVGNVADWYERADLFVMSSRFEGFPMTLAEALAAGLPAVSYDCETGPRDLIEDGVSGRLVRPVEDIGELAAALSEVMTDDTDRARMATRATSVRDRYSLERILGMWDDVFNASLAA
jgi:glycosyltransferase involved in cell wall biosynthesis